MKVDSKILTLVEKGQLQSNGVPLLKNRKMTRKDTAVKLLRKLMSTGMRRVEPHGG